MQGERQSFNPLLSLLSTSDAPKVLPNLHEQRADSVRQEMGVVG